MSLITSGIDFIESEKMNMCVPLIEWEKLASIMVLYDVILVIFIPFALISLANMLIVFKLMKLSNPFKLLRKSLTKSHTINFNYSIKLRKHIKQMQGIKTSKTFLGHINDDNCENDNISREMESFDFTQKAMTNVSNRMKKYSKTTTVLFTISTTFLILNCPIAMSKIWYIIKNSQNDVLQEIEGENVNLAVQDFNTSPIEELIERISCYLYYLNFSLNFLLYNLNGSKFRKAFLTMFRKRKNNSPQTRLMVQHQNRRRMRTITSYI